MVLSTGYHFWGSVARTSTRCFEQASICVGVGETKVNDFYVLVFVEQQVFWLQVAMANATLVDILDA